MVMIPKNENTIEHLIESRVIESHTGRPYLGMSGIGAECLAKLWYGFRWSSTTRHTARVERLFRRGDYEETVVIADLKRAGVEVFRREGEKKIEISGSREEQEEIVGYAGHAKGHPDGRVLGLPEAPKTEHLLEIKTMNDQYFSILQEEGVEHGFPVYYAQVNRYMKKMGLNRALFVATNKKDESRKYIRIRLDNELASELETKERIIVTSERPFRPTWSSDYYKCVWCHHKEVCHHGKAPNVNCRTCSRADICDNGKWECGLTGKEIDEEKQKVGCDLYKRLF